MTRNLLLLILQPLILTTALAREPLFPNELYPATFPEKIKIIDVNEDGYPDFVYYFDSRYLKPPYSSNPQFQIRILINDGNKGIAETIILDETEIILDDFPNESNMVLPKSIRFNESTFPPSIEYGEIIENEFQTTGMISGPWFEYINLYDFNKDGLDDLIFYQNYLGIHGFSILYRNADSIIDTGFIVKDEQPPSPPNRGWSYDDYYSKSAYFANGDINEDGILDKVERRIQGIFGGTFSTTVKIYLGTESGGFMEHHSYDGVFSDSFMLADFNNDNHLDLLQIPLVNYYGVMNLGNGNGTFQEGFNIPIGSGGTAFLGDFNGDGNADILNWNTGTDVEVYDAFHVSIGNGDGTFNPPRSFGVLKPKPTWGVGVKIVDANGDQFDDLWFESYESDPNGIKGIWLNQHQGTSNNNEYGLYK